MHLLPLAYSRVVMTTRDKKERENEEGIGGWGGGGGVGIHVFFFLHPLPFFTPASQANIHMDKLWHRIIRQLARERCKL